MTNVPNYHDPAKAMAKIALANNLVEMKLPGYGTVNIRITEANQIVFRGERSVVLDGVARSIGGIFVKTNSNWYLDGANSIMQGPKPPIKVYRALLDTLTDAIREHMDNQPDYESLMVVMGWKAGLKDIEDKLAYWEVQLARQRQGIEDTLNQISALGMKRAAHIEKMPEELREESTTD